jgi:hypothetical protein
MAKVALSVLGLVLLVACNDAGSSPESTPGSAVVPMNARAWSILYSPGMAPHPTHGGLTAWRINEHAARQTSPFRSLISANG